MFTKKLTVYHTVRSTNSLYRYYYATDKNGVSYYKCVYAGIHIKTGTQVKTWKTQLLRDIIYNPHCINEFNWKKLV